MTVEFNLVKNIFNTLPIGYYLGRRINCELIKGHEAYFDPINDKIVIGYDLILQGLNNMSDDINLSKDDIEQLIRGLLYHEISHVIMTPANLKSSYSLKLSKIINVFEDERIETVLKHKYMGTDFKKNVVLINNYKGEAPNNEYNAFYYLVRYHNGKPEFLEQVKKIITYYAYITACSSSNQYSSYVSSIIDLYNQVIYDFNKSKNFDENKSDKTTNNKLDKKSNFNDFDDFDDEDENLDDFNDDDNMNNDDTYDSNNTNNNDDKKSDEVSSKAGSTEKTESVDSNMSTINKKAESIDDSENESEVDVKDDISEHNEKSVYDDLIDIEDLDIDINTDKVDSVFKSSLKTLMNEYHDPELCARLSEIISAKLKQKKNTGAAINSYSGRLNPRLVTREDYKWWTQQNRAGHMRQYSKVHFNLFIDNSGSFRHNDLAMNKFIRALESIKYEDFDFDVITINTRINEWPTTKQKFESNGGNRLPESIAMIIKKHNKPNCNNFNIVLFDGDAHSDDNWNNSTEPFRHFDSNNTIIITDVSNRRYIDRANITKAKVKYTKNYCTEFIDETCNLLERMI